MFPGTAGGQKPQNARDSWNASVEKEESRQNHLSVIPESPHMQPRVTPESHQSHKRDTPTPESHQSHSRVTPESDHLAAVVDMESVSDTFELGLDEFACTCSPQPTAQERHSPP